MFSLLMKMTLVYHFFINYFILSLLCCDFFQVLIIVDKPYNTESLHLIPQRHILGDPWGNLFVEV